MSDETLHDTLTSAYDSAVSTLPGGEAPATTPPVSTPLSPSEPPATTPPGEGAKDDRPRDAQGRYLEKPKEPKRDLLADPLKAPAPTDAHPKPGETPAPVVEPPKFKTPQAWKGEAKGLFSSLPPAVQAEIHRRESEVMSGLQQAASARQAVAELQQVIAPYMPNIQAAHGGNVIAAMKLLFQSDNTLRHGAPREKARLWVDIGMNYGIDVNLADAELAARLKGQPLPDDPSEQMAHRLLQQVDQRIQPMQTFLSRMEEREAQRLAMQESKANESVDEFAADPAHIHFEEVHKQMGRLMQVAHEDGLTMTLQEAYDHAIALNPTLRQAEAKRKEQEAANARAEAAQRAKRAAGLPSGGAPSGTPSGSSQGNTLNDDLHSAWAAQEAR